MAYGDSDLRGIGGWLAFFVIIVAFLSPLRIAITVGGTVIGQSAQLSVVYGSSWPLVRVGEGLIGALSIALCWAMAWRLAKGETWSTIRFVIAGIWLLGLGSNLAELLLLASAGRFSASILAGLSAPGLIQAIIFGGLWTAYFLRSQRVANTYYKEGANDEVSEIFS